MPNRYEITDEDGAKYRDLFSTMHGIMHYPSAVPRVCMNEKRVAILVIMFKSDGVHADLWALSNREIEANWKTYVKEENVFQWYYYDDLDVALIPDWKVKPLRPQKLKKVKHD